MPRTKQKENYAVRSNFPGYRVKKHICEEKNLVTKEYIQNYLDVNFKKCYGNALTNYYANL